MPGSNRGGRRGNGRSVRVEGRALPGVVVRSAVSCAAGVVSPVPIGDDELCSVSGGEFGEEVAHVGFRRGVAHEELVGEFGVGESFGDGGEYFAFAGGELLKPWVWRSGDGSANEVFDEASGDAWREKGFAGGDNSDGSEQFRWKGVFEEEAGRSGA